MSARSSLRVGGWCALVLALACCDRTPAPAPAPPEVQVATGAFPRELYADDRIAHLMGGCPKNDPFLEDTSDPIPVLVSNLSFATVDPARAAREELAAAGDRAIPELTRAFDAAYGAQYLSQRAQNVLDVLGGMRTDAGRPLILRGLVHPQETLRKAAARALVPHARPEDYDVLLECLAVASPDSMGDIGLALLAADRGRAARQLPEWIEKGMPKSFLELLVTNLCTIRDPDVLERWRVVLPSTEGKLRVTMQVAVANAPDLGLLSELRAWLADTTMPLRRQLVAQALAAAGGTRELAPILSRTDPDETLRRTAASAVATAPFTDATREVLRAALADPNGEIRDLALMTLCENEDATALDTAIEMLAGSRPELESAQKALRAPLLRRPDLARRAFDLLVRCHAGEAGAGLVDERTLVRAIGQVPLAEAAQYVMAAGAKEEGRIQGLPAHRWYAQAAGNSGSAGLAWLRSRWHTEPDPVKRMDFVMAGSFEKSDAVREFLVAVLESPRTTPCEMLYAADRLARLAPAEYAAPILKRAALRVNDRAVRPAFHCLLWMWYGRKVEPEKALADQRR